MRHIEVILITLVFIILISISAYGNTLTARLSILEKPSNLTIKILSPKNTSYIIFKSYSRIDTIPLTFAISKQASWIGYSLDGASNKTITGNATLTISNSGHHNVQIFAKDKSNVTSASNKVFFTVIVINTCIWKWICWL